MLVRQRLFQRPVQPCADGPAVKAQGPALRQLLRQELGQRRHARLAGAHQLYAAALQLPFRLQKVSPVRPQVCALPQHRQRSRRAGEPGQEFPGLEMRPYILRAVKVVGDDDAARQPARLHILPQRGQLFRNGHGAHPFLPSIDKSKHA